MHIEIDEETGVEYSQVCTKPDIDSRYGVSYRPKLGQVSTTEEDPYAIYNALCMSLKEHKDPNIEVSVDVANYRNGEYNNYNLYDKVYVKIPGFERLVTAIVSKVEKNLHDIGENTVELSNFNVNTKVATKETVIYGDNVSFKYPKKGTLTIVLADMSSENEGVFRDGIMAENVQGIKHHAHRQQDLLQPPGRAGAAHRLPEPDAGGGGRGGRADAGPGGPERDDGGVAGHADPVRAEHDPGGHDRGRGDPGGAVLGQGRPAHRGKPVQPDAPGRRAGVHRLLRGVRGRPRHADARLHPRRAADRHRQRVPAGGGLVVSHHGSVAVLPHRDEGDGSRDAQRGDQLQRGGDQHRAERRVHLRPVGRAPHAGPRRGPGHRHGTGGGAGAVPGIVPREELRAAGMAAAV